VAIKECQGQGRTQNTLTKITVNPDNHRGTAVRNGIRIRRQRLYAFQIDRTTVRHKQQAVENFFQGAPGLVAAAKTWPEATAKAHRQWFIANAHDDLFRLCDTAKGRS